MCYISSRFSNSNTQKCSHAPVIMALRYYSNLKTYLYAVMHHISSGNFPFFAIALDVNMQTSERAAYTAKLECYRSR